MRFIDPSAVKLDPREIIVSAWGQRQGSRENQEDSVGSFKDEFFAVGDGVGGMPHGEVASRVAVDQAIWGYKLVRTKPYYWQDKKLFMKRIFRSANIGVWKEHTLKDYPGGMATTLSVAMIGSHVIWIGCAGDSRVFVWQKEQLVLQTDDDRDEQGNLTKALGLSRYSLIPQYATTRLSVGDVLLMTTDGITNVMDSDLLTECIASLGNQQKDLTDCVAKILDKAQSLGSSDNMTACLVKRVSAPQK